MRTGSVHFAVARAMTWLLFSTNLLPLRDRALAQIDEEAQLGAGRDDRLLYARTVAGGWVVLGLVSGLGTIALALVGHAVGGASGGTAGLATGLGAVFFCVSGALYASWRMLREYGRRDATRTAVLRNTSLVAQAIVAGIAILLATRG